MRYLQLDLFFDLNGHFLCGDSKCARIYGLGRGRKAVHARNTTILLVTSVARTSGPKRRFACHNPTRSLAELACAMAARTSAGSEANRSTSVTPAQNAFLEPLFSLLRIRPGPVEPPIPVPEKPPIFHPHAQLNDFRRDFAEIVHDDFPHFTRWTLPLSHSTQQ
jgi:hypothetical protein